MPPTQGDMGAHFNKQGLTWENVVLRVTLFLGCAGNILRRLYRQTSTLLLNIYTETFARRIDENQNSQFLSQIKGPCGLDPIIINLSTCLSLTFNIAFSVNC